MRDNRDFKETAVRRLLQGTTVVSTATVLQQSVRSFRSEPVATVPSPSGIYHRITGYEAFYMLASYMSGQVKWKHIYLPESNTYTWTMGELPSVAWTFGFTPLLTPQIPAALIAWCRSAMDKQIREDLDISVFAGEARETARTLAGILSTLLQLVTGLKRAVTDLIRSGTRPHYGSWREVVGYTVREARQASRKGSKAAGAYLYFMYAIRPLVSDVMKIAQHWDDRLNAPLSKRLHVSLKDGTYNAGSFPRSAYRWIEGRCERGIKAGATATVLNPQLLRASQYGLTSPLSLAWELTTLSFVVDWFYGIGPFIRSLEQPLGVAIEDYFETMWVDNSFDYFYDVYSDLYKSNLVKLIPPHQVERVHVRSKGMLRTASPHIPPIPPFVRTGVSSTQVVTLIALIKQRM